MTYIGLRSDLPFPILTNDILLRQAVAHKPEIRFMEQPNGTVVCSYLISCDGTFDDPYSREARGVVFDQRGSIIARPLHKFSNLNQNPENMYHALDWSKVARVMDKRDGSMIHTVKKIQGIEAFYCSANFTLKSKKSYDSDVAKSAREFMATKQNDLALKLATYGYRGVNDVWPDYVGFCNSCIEHEQTAIFEWTSPVARIVLAYPKDELKLLHVRDNVTGDYKKRPFLEELARKYNVPMVDDRDDLIEMLRTEEGVLRYVEETEGVEGIVVQFENGNMVKIKTKWYMERHHKMTFVRMRDIVEMVLNESLDDLKAFYVGEGVDITEINEIEASVVNAIDEIIWEVNRIVGSAGLADRKSMAMKYGVQGENHPLFKLIMHKWEGKDPDYKGFYERNYLSSVPLRQLNMLQTIAEDE